MSYKLHVVLVAGLMLMMASSCRGEREERGFILGKGLKMFEDLGGGVRRTFNGFINRLMGRNKKNGEDHQYYPYAPYPGGQYGVQWRPPPPVYKTVTSSSFAVFHEHPNSVVTPVKQSGERVGDTDPSFVGEYHFVLHKEEDNKKRHAVKSEPNLPNQRKGRPFEGSPLINNLSQSVDGWVAMLPPKITEEQLQSDILNDLFPGKEKRRARKEEQHNSEAEKAWKGFEVRVKSEEPQPVKGIEIIESLSRDIKEIKPEVKVVEILRPPQPLTQLESIEELSGNSKRIEFEPERETKPQIPQVIEITGNDLLRNIKETEPKPEEKPFKEEVLQLPQEGLVESFPDRGIRIVNSKPEFVHRSKFSDSGNESSVRPRYRRPPPGYKPLEEATKMTRGLLVKNPKHQLQGIGSGPQKKSIMAVEKGVLTYKNRNITSLPNEEKESDYADGPTRKRAPFSARIQSKDGVKRIKLTKKQHGGVNIAIRDRSVWPKAVPLQQEAIN